MIFTIVEFPDHFCGKTFTTEKVDMLGSVHAAYRDMLRLGCDLW